MCGIAGIYTYHYASPQVDSSELVRIQKAMSRRGPDGSGEWYSADHRLGLAHTRLAILDCSEQGAQPMISRDGNTIISFNGEIYNFIELRDQLKGEGCVFRSGTDTEVLLYLYQKKGEAMVHDLRGMFAFVLWDEKKKALWMVRDPYGIKPLYYADDGWAIRVASQVRALFAGGRVSRRIEPAGAAGFFLNGYIPEPYTLFQEIRQLPAGCYAWVTESGMKPPIKYFSKSRIYELAYNEMEKLSLSQAIENFKTALVRTVKYHFVSDVPVGVFLSAGIDSGSLVGLARTAGLENIKTMTLVFEEFKNTDSDESVYATQLGKYYQTDHQNSLLTHSDFKSSMTDFLSSMDQPSIDGANTYFISRAMHTRGIKVALSGLGGDELLGGYNSFFHVPLLLKLFRIWKYLSPTGKMITEVMRRILNPTSSVKVKLCSVFEYGSSWPGAYLLKRSIFMPFELSGLLGKDMAREGLHRLDLLKSYQDALRGAPDNDFIKVSILEQSFYIRSQLLRDADWASMSQSLELRTPYVESKFLIEAATAICAILLKYGRRGKEILSQMPDEPLPVEFVRRPKTGFELPMRRWIEEDKTRDHWRQVPFLARPDCNWFRRWAYVVYRHMQENTGVRG